MTTARIHRLSLSPVIFREQLQFNFQHLKYSPHLHWSVMNNTVIMHLKVSASAEILDDLKGAE